MRSGLIFSVSLRFTNRYLLCRMLSASARKMYREGSSASQSINRSLQALHDAKDPAAPGSSLGPGIPALSGNGPAPVP